MHVQRIVADPGGEVAELFLAYRSFYDLDDRSDEARAFVAARLDQADSLIWAAFVDGAAVGFTQVYPSHSSLSMWTDWQLNDLYVAPAGRRTGAGRALVRAVKDAAASAGVRAVRLETQPSNEIARALYDSEQFERSSPEPSTDGYLDYYWTPSLVEPVETTDP